MWINSEKALQYYKETVGLKMQMERWKMENAEGNEQYVISEGNKIVVDEVTCVAGASMQRNSAGCLAIDVRENF